MSSAENGRLVWITREQRDWFERFQHSSGPLREAIDAWDAAPVDPVVAVTIVIRERWGQTWSEEWTPQEIVAAADAWIKTTGAAVDAVLAALGVPQRPTPRDEAPHG